jgi:hypothetical protein
MPPRPPRPPRSASASSPRSACARPPKASNSQISQAREGATKAGLKLLEVAKEDADAGFAAWRDFLSAKTPLEAFDVSAKYWRGRLETRIAQAQDLGAFARKVADDAVRPVQERIEKFTKAAA